VKVLVITPNYPPAVNMGGSQAAIHELAEAICEYAEVDVITTTFPGRNTHLPLGKLAGDSAKVRRLRHSKRVPPHAQLFWSERHVLSEAVAATDFVILSELRTGLNLAVALMAKRQGRPYAVIPWGSAAAGTATRARLRRLVWDRVVGRHVTRRAAVMFGQTEWELNDIRRLRPNSLSLVPLALALEDLSDVSIMREHTGNFKIVTVARLAPLKSLDILIRAMAGMPDHISLTIVGGDNGSEAELRQLAVDLGVEARVVFAGALYGEDLTSVLISSDVFLLAPTYNEGTSRASLLAAWHGCPTIVSKAVELPFLRDYEAGWECASTTEAVATSIIRAEAAWAGPHFDEMRERAHRMVQENHDVRKAASIILCELSGGNGSRSKRRVHS
jgi:glycosyltransferase involved in cell wall biosynthesis